ncbi:MAG: hypothetical protein JOZ52_06305 [Acidobacteria bacterium]|nr:hypothetical protein [Acidobacteriota bacterium]
MTNYGDAICEASQLFSIYPKSDVRSIGSDFQVLNSIQELASERAEGGVPYKLKLNYHKQSESNKLIMALNRRAPAARAASTAQPTLDFGGEKESEEPGFCGHPALREKAFKCAAGRLLAAR